MLYYLNMVGGLHMFVLSKKTLFIFLFVVIPSAAVFMIEKELVEDTRHVTIFAHGLGGWAETGEMHYTGIVGGKIIGEDGPEWGPLRQTCLAQDGDIEVVIKQIKEHAQKNMTLLGLSKGAAVMLNTVADLFRKTKPCLPMLKQLL